MHSKQHSALVLAYNLSVRLTSIAKMQLFDIGMDIRTIEIALDRSTSITGTAVLQVFRIEYILSQEMQFCKKHTQLLKAAFWMRSV